MNLRLPPSCFVQVEDGMGSRAGAAKKSRTMSSVWSRVHIAACSRISAGLRVIENICQLPSSAELNRCMSRCCQSCRMATPFVDRQIRLVERRSIRCTSDDQLRSTLYRSISIATARTSSSSSASTLSSRSRPDSASISSAGNSLQSSDHDAIGHLIQYRDRCSRSLIGPQQSLSLVRTSLRLPVDQLAVELSCSSANAGHQHRCFAQN